MTELRIHGEPDPNHPGHGILRTEGLEQELVLEDIPESMVAPAAWLLEQAAQTVLAGELSSPLPLVTEEPEAWLLELARWALDAEPVAARRQAADLLAERDGPASFDRLIDCCLTDVDEEMRRHVACLVQTIDADTATARMIDALGDQNRDVAGQAALVLEQHQDPDSLALLLSALEDPRSQVRWLIAEVLGRICNPDSVEALITALDDPDKKVRGAVAWTLGELADPRAVPGLIVALSDDAGEVRACVGRALAEIGDERAVEPLVPLLADEFTPARRWSAFALSRVAGVEAVEPMIAALGDADAEVRQNAARGLGGWRDVRAVPALLVLLGDADAETCWTAIDALADIGDPQAIEPLFALLDGADQVGTVVLAALEAVERLGAAERLPRPLVSLLAHPDVEARQHASAALSGMPPALPLLIEHLQREDLSHEQRVYAIPALAALGDPVAVEPLEALQADCPEWFAEFLGQAIDQLTSP